jgi:hypothetical protein
MRSFTCLLFLLVLCEFMQMLQKVPKSESLKCTLQRSRVYWDKVLAPALRDGKTILVVGHENNLRSLIMNLENIAPNDVINLCLPRAVPLAYQIDLNTLCPINTRPDGYLDSATGFLRGEWLGGDASVTEILNRDRKQVYDTSVTTNLEIGSVSHQNGPEWMKVANGLPEVLPGARALGNETAGSFLGSAPVSASSFHDPICHHNGHLLTTVPSPLPPPPLKHVSVLNGATSTTASPSMSQQSPDNNTGIRNQQQAAA